MALFGYGSDLRPARLLFVVHYPLVFPQHRYKPVPREYTYHNIKRYWQRSVNTEEKTQRYKTNCAQNYADPVHTNTIISIIHIKKISVLLHPCLPLHGFGLLSKNHYLSRKEPKKYAKVAVVATAGGDYATPAAALAATATWCGTPSAINPCLVKLMPGVYDLAASALAMQSYVDLDGSGKSNSIITGTLDSLTAGVVNGANSSTLSNLTVQNTGGAGKLNAIAIYNNAVSTRIESVTANAGGAAHGYALYDTGQGVVQVRNCILNGSTNTVFNDNGATTQTFATAFTGGSAANNGTAKLICVASTDTANTFFERSCPPLNNLQVVATQPEQGSYNAFPANGVIKAQFNNDLSAASVSAATFKVLDGNTGVSLPGTVSYSSATRSALFTPSAPFVSTFLSVVATTGIRDLSGGALANDYSWQIFGLSTNTAPLVVTITQPAQGSIGVAATTPINANFNKQIDIIAVSGGNFTVKDAANNAVAGKVTTYTGGISFAPTSPLTLGTIYTATVSGVKDLTGTGLSAPFSYSFTTAPLATPAAVTATASATQATVSWQPVANAASYNLYWSTQPLDAGQGSSSTVGSPESVNKISNVTSPYSHTVPQPAPFTGILRVSAAGTLTAGQKIGGLGFDLVLPPAVSAYGASLIVSDAASGAVLNYTPLTSNLIRVGITSSPGLATGALVHVFFNGAPTGVSITDFSVANAQVLDTSGAAIASVTLLAENGSTAGTPTTTR